MERKPNLRGNILRFTLWRPWLCLAAIAVAIGMTGCISHRRHLNGFEIRDKPAGANSFLAGAWKVELTPPPGYPIAGHGPPAAIARGYWSRLYARAFYFRDRTGTPLVLVSCDLFAMAGGLWQAVLQKVNEQVYLPPESLVIAATHPHQGPGGFMTAGAYNTLAGPLPGFDRTLFKEYVERISSAILSAADHAEHAGPAQLVLHQGKALVPEDGKSKGLQRNRAIVPFFQNAANKASIHAVEPAMIMAASTVPCPDPDEPCPRLQAVDNTLFGPFCNRPDAERRTPGACGTPSGLCPPMRAATISTSLK